MSESRYPPGEIARKAVHIGMGGFALLLRFLTWKQAAIFALAALAFNLFVLPVLGGRRLHREGEETSRWSIGIVAYPLTVLALVLLWRDRLEIAAAAWGLLAVGDGLASIAGKGISSPPLPWNRAKSWAGFFAYLLFGGLAAGWLLLWTRPGHYSGSETLALAFIGALAGALVESLPTKLDDNLTAPLGAAAVMALFARTFDGASAWPLLLGSDSLRALGLAAGVNAGVAALALAFRLLGLSGAVGGFVVGTAILFGGGWGGWGVLWTFFALGTLATKWKYAEKAKLGAAQEAGGKRGAKHAFANCGLAALLVLVAAGAGERRDLREYRALLEIAFVAAFATALADTFGSEIGSAYGRSPRLITTWKKVPPGTDGAVSLPGTVGGLVGAAIVALVGWKSGIIPQSALAPVVLGGFVGTTVESFLGATLEQKKLVDNEVQNFLNTVVGALAAVLLARLLHA